MQFCNCYIAIYIYYKTAFIEKNMKWTTLLFTVENIHFFMEVPSLNLNVIDGEICINRGSISILSH